LKDHQEVVGCAGAIELLYESLDDNKPLSGQLLSALHRALQTAVVTDTYKPLKS
jgi:hypothetical protein